MKPFFLRFVDKVRARGQKKSAALPGAGAKNLEELRKYVEELYAFVCNSGADITKMMEGAGLEILVDDKENLIPEVDKYPELKKLYLEHVSKKKELKQILHAHPEMWKPIEDDACLYYDDIRQKIKAIRDADVQYIRNLEQAMEPLEAKFGDLDPNSCFKDKDAELDAPLDDATANLMNEYFYLFYLLFDALATMGDKQDQVLWDAVPHVIKNKYVQYVNDKMVQILASDDRLVEWVKNFDINETDPDAHEYFIRLLEKRLNAEVFEKAKKPLSMNVFLNRQNPSDVGTCDQHIGQVKLNTASWAGCASGQRSVNEVVGNIKHEVFGHYANMNLPLMGLYGSMKDFMREIQTCTHSVLAAAMDFRVIEAVSPLLKEHYVIDMPSESIVRDLRKQGWDLYYIRLKDDMALYKNTFEERSACLVTPTHDINGQIDRYRASHGLPPVEKSR